MSPIRTLGVLSGGSIPPHGSFGAANIDVWARESIMTEQLATHADAADVEKRLRIFQWLLGGISLFCAASVPWALVVQGDVAVIRHEMEVLEVPPKWFEARVNANHVSIKENSLAIQELMLRIKLLEMEKQP